MIMESVVLTLALNARLLAAPPDPPPARYSLAVTSYSITLSWPANEHPSGALYQADIWSAGNFPTSLFLLSTTAVFGGLSADTAYNVRVRARIGEGVPRELVSFSTATLPVEPALAPPPAGARFWIQVGSFTDYGRARELADELKSAHHDAYVFLEVVSGVRYHNVRVGPFDSRDEAKAAADQLAVPGAPYQLVFESAPATGQPKPTQAAVVPAVSARAAVAPSVPPHPGLWVVRGNPCWVQVGAYSDSTLAQGLADALGSLGHRVIVSDAPANAVSLHQVRIGPFATWREARDAANRLEADKTLDQLALSLKK